MNLTNDEFANLPEAIKRRNPELFTPRLPASAPERPEGKPLVRRVSRKKEGGHSPEAVPCYEIVFTIYARRPCDWDGWHIKPLQDLLVRIGALPGDDWYFVSGHVRSRKVSTEAEERTEITLTPTPKTD